MGKNSCLVEGEPVTLEGEVTPQIAIPGSSITIRARVCNSSISIWAITCYVIVQDDLGNRIIDWNGDLAALQCYTKEVTYTLDRNINFRFDCGYKDIFGNWKWTCGFYILAQVGAEVYLYSRTYPEQEILPDVKICLDNNCVMTDSNGEATLKLPFGTYKVTAEKSGYACELGCVDVNITTNYFYHYVFMKKAIPIGGGKADIRVSDQYKKLTAEKGMSVSVEGIIINTSWNPLDVGHYKVDVLKWDGSTELVWEGDIWGGFYSGWKYTFTMPEQDVKLTFYGYRWTGTTWSKDDSDTSEITLKPSLSIKVLLNNSPVANADVIVIPIQPRDLNDYQKGVTDANGIISFILEKRLYLIISSVKIGDKSYVGYVNNYNLTENASITINLEEYVEGEEFWVEVDTGSEITSAILSSLINEVGKYIINLVIPVEITKSQAIGTVIKIWFIPKASSPAIPVIMTFLICLVVAFLIVHFLIMPLLTFIFGREKPAHPSLPVECDKYNLKEKCLILTIFDEKGAVPKVSATNKIWIDMYECNIPGVGCGKFVQCDPILGIWCGINPDGLWAYKTSYELTDTNVLKLQGLESKSYAFEIKYKDELIATLEVPPSLLDREYKIKAFSEYWLWFWKYGKWYVIGGGIAIGALALYLLTRPPVKIAIERKLVSEKGG